MPTLVARFLSSGHDHNLVLPGKQASFRFTNPPPEADNVQVKILEDVVFLDHTTSVKNRFVAGFLGKIRGREFTADKLFGAPPDPSEPDAVIFRFVHPAGISKGDILCMMPKPERVLSHTLTLVTEGDFGGKHHQWRGDAPLHVEYPIAMVVPSVPTFFDKKLNWILPWAKQWKAHKKKYRKVVATQTATTSLLPAKITPAHYDGWIADIVTAAKFATSGVVVLALGHGKPAPPVSWTNLVPEDNKRVLTGVAYRLRIDKNDLLPYSKPPKPGGTISTPGGVIQARLDALDRLGAALADTPCRRLLFHTCQVGKDAEFVQLLADRIRIPVMMQREWIVYEGLTPEEKATYPGNTEKGYYEFTAPVLPKALRQLPVHKLSSVRLPSDPPPPMFGPP